MKNGKRPTLKQKEAIEWTKKDPEKWLVVKVLHDERQMEIVHRETGTLERVPFLAS